MTIDIDQLVARMRTLEIDSEPEGWPAVKMRDISALCDAVEGSMPGPHCVDGDRCVCGGDTARVRAGCPNWRTSSTAGKGVLSALDRLQERLEAGATIDHQAGMWCLFDSRSEGIVSGVTLRSMLMNLIFVDC